jgi:gamma-glutamyltranspeptidase/glutathione hydrolase
MNGHPDRRDVLRWAGGAMAAGVLSRATADDRPRTKGVIVGQPEAAKAGGEVLAEGGNAVDAVIAAALVAGVVAVQQCGIGGYGGHAVLATDGGRKVTAIDFNTAAPAAMKADVFAPDEQGRVKDQTNERGSLAAGVPGTLAGLQLALDRYGTRTFDQVARSAIRYARDGFAVDAALANSIRVMRSGLLKDPASARLLLRDGEPLKVGAKYRNPELADLLEALAEKKSAEDFYRGEIGRKIAAAFRKNGGLVTADDLGTYRAREVAPLELEWRGYSIRTAPLTAGGATVLQALATLKALGWEDQADESRRTQAKLEALRLAWHDRLRLFGDPTKVNVPLQHLLSTERAKESATLVEKALREGKPVPAATDGRSADGTVHLSAFDRMGNAAALTLTHGNAFGALVTVEGLGLVLGHGMSRFDSRPNHPNGPGPGKRPLHNMCPTVVLRDGRAVLALGAVGERKIPNAVFEVLAQMVGSGKALEDAVASSRLHTEGGLNVVAEAKVPETEREYLKKAGYTVSTGSAAIVSAATFDAKTGDSRMARR